MSERNFIFYTPPELSPWQVTVADRLTLRPRKGREPCAFHRLMQRVILGFKWEKCDV